MWSIRVLSGQHTGQIYDLKMGKNVFGRGGISDFKVQSLGISKEHCEIHVYKDKMMIVDLKSSNGTFVNGVKIQNSIIRVGDKVSLFDVIMDIIPAPDIRPRPVPKAAPLENPPVPAKKRRPTQPVGAYMGSPPAIPNFPQSYPQQGNAALQMQSQMYQQSMPSQFSQTTAAPAQAVTPPLTMSEKIENYIENVVMPGIYKLAIVFSFKQILQAFVIIFIFSVTLLSAFPMTNIIKEANMQESVKRAQSIARAMATFNQQALMSGQMATLSTAEAQKEEGIKDAFIIQQVDGLIIAPPEKAGRDEANPLVLKARTEIGKTWMMLDKNTVGASFPIAVFDPATGEATAKYHAIVTYDVSSLNVDEGRVVGLMMQTLMIASAFGLLLYFLFARLIEYPIRSLNQQIEKALIEKSDRTEVPFDYPAFQKLVSNVNTILNRVLTGDTSNAVLKPQQNKDLEYSNLADMISHPVIIVDASQRVVAINSGFEELAQTTKDAMINQSYQTLNDSSLVQNMDSLTARAKQSPFEKQSDKIPFSQFECEIHCQVFMNADNDAEYFILTLIQTST